MIFRSKRDRRKTKRLKKANLNYSSENIREILGIKKKTNFYL